MIYLVVCQYHFIHKPQPVC